MKKEESQGKVAHVILHANRFHRSPHHLCFPWPSSALPHLTLLWHLNIHKWLCRLLTLTLKITLSNRKSNHSFSIYRWKCLQLKAVKRLPQGHWRNGSSASMEVNPTYPAAYLCLRSLMLCSANSLHVCILQQMQLNSVSQLSLRFFYQLVSLLVCFSQ